MDTESQEEDLERPCAKNPVFQSTGQETKARPLRGVTSGARRVAGPGKKHKVQTQKNKPSRRWRFPATGLGEMEASAFPMMPSWLSLPSGAPYAFYFSGLTMFSQVSVGDLHSWET